MDEFTMHNTCALRFDGYAWAAAKHRSVNRLMNAYWLPESFAALFRARPETQWAVWFMQQRSYRWNESEPHAAGLSLWRQLFLRLARLEPDPRFTDEYWNQDWNAKYRPHLDELEVLVNERLSRDADLFEPIALTLRAAKLGIHEERTD
jgi:hypothetical protein